MFQNFGSISIPGFDATAASVAANNTGVSQPNHLLLFGLTFTFIAALLWAVVKWEHQLATVLADAVPVAATDSDEKSDSNVDDSFWATWDGEPVELATTNDSDLFDATMPIGKEAGWLAIS